MRTIIPKPLYCTVPVKEEKEYRCVGKSLPRLDAIDKVTGEGQFVDDISMKGMLFTKILRSPIAHGEILSIDTSQALKMEGVIAVITGEEINGRRIGDCINDQPPMAYKKVRFVGEPVAAVVAVTSEIAMIALDLIKAEYKELPAVFNAREAMEPSAPLVHDHVEEYECFKTFCPKPGTNIFHHFKLRKGNVDEGFGQADYIFENEYEYPHISHAQLEPHGCIALWKQDGSIEVWASAQSPFLVRSVIAKFFKIPYSKVRVVTPYIGGGFGGKSDVTIEPLTAYIAGFVKGRPVKLVLEREEMFFGSVIGRGAQVRMKTGVTKEGKLTAVCVDLAFNSGAYGEYCINVVVGGGQNSTGPYYIPNVNIDSYAVYTNLPFVGAFRGYGHPEGHWAAERQMDFIAEKMGWDPVEFRMKNILRPGLTNALGQTIKIMNGDLEKCLTECAKELEWDKWQKEKKVWDGKKRYVRGKGLACLMKSPVMATSAPSMAQIRFNEDCSVNLQFSATDMGQGILTVMAQITAETLKIPVEKVKVSIPIDTERHPYDWQTVASRATWMLGNAVIRACNATIKQIKELAAQVWEMDSISDIQYDGERVFIPGSDKCIPLSALVMGYSYEDGHAIGGPATGSGYFLPPHMVFHHKETGMGDAAAEWTFACQGFDITVDTLTADVQVNKMVTAIDAGTIINPTTATGQVIGGMVQGYGATINETIIYDNKGKIRNPDLTDYKIPTADDFENTQFKVIFVETPQDDGPYGARAIAEHPVVAVAPAFANALRDCLGIHYFRLPINADRLMEELRKKTQKVEVGS